MSKPREQLFEQSLPRKPQFVQKYLSCIKYLIFYCLIINCVHDTYTPQPGLLTTQNPTSIHNIFIFLCFRLWQAGRNNPPTPYLLTLQFFIFGITTTSMQSLKILHHFLTTVSLNIWKCYSWFQKGIEWDVFKASSSSLLKVRSKLALMNVWWSMVVSDMLRQIKEHETRKEPHDKPQSCCSWKAVMPDIFWVVELVSGKHCIWTDELQFILYISKDK